MKNVRYEERLKPKKTGDIWHYSWTGGMDDEHIRMMREDMWRDRALFSFAFFLGMLATTVLFLWR